MAPDLTPARWRGTPESIMNESKELPQPKGIETKEVGGGRAVAGYVLGTPERLRIARVVHEANRAYCQSIGDTSQVPFDEAPAWQVESVLNGIDGITSGEIRAPHQSHESWMAQKQKDGWVYGEVKNEKTKEHPCMVPYEALPSEQRMKDYLFFAIVKTLTMDIGGRS